MLDKNQFSRIKMHEIMQNPWVFPERVIKINEDDNQSMGEDLENSSFLI